MRHMGDQSTTLGSQFFPSPHGSKGQNISHWAWCQVPAEPLLLPGQCFFGFFFLFKLRLLLLTTNVLRRLKTRVPVFLSCPLQ